MLGENNYLKKGLQKVVLFDFRCDNICCSHAALFGNKQRGCVLKRCYALHWLVFGVHLGSSCITIVLRLSS